MVSLTSLHHEALEEIFHQLNQYHTSALAPLHSKLYYVAKPKLYRNIYVYIPWSLNDFLEPNEGNSTFRFPKDLNNCKSTRYTIISTDTLERYLMEMDGTQEINRLELYGHNMTMIDCIFRHLTKIKYFELVTVLHPKSGPRYTNSLQKFLDTYGYGTHYITPNGFGEFSDHILISGRSVKVDEWYCCNVIDKLHSSKNLKELSIITFCSRYRMRTRFNTQLHVLNFYDCLDSMGSNFLLCDFFDTNCLRELSLKGDLDLNTTFNCTDMEKEFPKLEQLCLRFSGPRYAPTALYKLTNFRHSRLRSLVISSKSCHECDARARQVIPMSSQLNINSSTNYKNATTQLFNKFDLDKKIEAFAKILGDNASGHRTLSDVAEAYEQTFGKIEELQQQQLEDLLCKHYRTKFTVLDANEKSTMIMIIQNITGFYQLQKQPLQRDISDKGRILLRKIIRDFYHSAENLWNETIDFDYSLGNLITISLITFFTQSQIPLDSTRGVAANQLNEKDFNDFKFSVVAGEHDFNRSQLMNIKLNQFCRESLMLDPFQIPGAEKVACMEQPWAADLTRDFILPILQFAGIQFERQFDTCLYQEYSIEHNGIKKIPDLCPYWRRPYLEAANYLDVLAKLNYTLLFTTETIAKTEILRVNEDKQVVLKVTNYGQRATESPLDPLQCFLLESLTDQAFRMTDELYTQLAEVLLKKDIVESAGEGSPNSSGSPSDHDSKPRRKYKHTEVTGAHPGGEGSIATGKPSRNRHKTRHKKSSNTKERMSQLLQSFANINKLSTNLVGTGSDEDIDIELNRVEVRGGVTEVIEGDGGERKNDKDKGSAIETNKDKEDGPKEHEVEDEAGENYATFEHTGSGLVNFEDEEFRTLPFKEKLKHWSKAWRPRPRSCPKSRPVSRAREFLTLPRNWTSQRD
ncbi:hypothetical protein I9W82_000119 [Candida metapsilosis]|uniref:Uncharacterized protein n=1 Tax=Candida metapsilosis TaxID=273372 RepID=A0A8H7ZI82_9ASCO|nr:hypothetical protein I9W82_000119 [Candida metapsilosis]